MLSLRKGDPFAKIPERTSMHRRMRATPITIRATRAVLGNRASKTPAESKGRWVKFAIDKTQGYWDNKNMKTFTLAFFQRTGKKGGSAKSKAKAAAARINGRKGGRPRKDVSR